MLDIILAGVGGQGILSIAFVLDSAAMASGYSFKQAEVHGMSQRGGAVQSHLRISTDRIYSDLIPHGRVDLVLSVEPLESLRYAHSLSPRGTVVSSTTPFVNIPDYPELPVVLDQIMALPQHVLINAALLARHAGSRRSENMVMLGAAAWLYPFEPALCEDFIRARFATKSERVIEANINAFRFGQTLSAAYRALLELGLPARQALALCDHLEPRELDMEALPLFKAAVEAHPDIAWPDERVICSLEVGRKLQQDGSL